MNVKVYNQYYAVYNEDKTLLHPSSGYTLLAFNNLLENIAKDKVIELFEQAKLLGKSYVLKSVSRERGYAELTITFEDGKVLNKIIYTK